VQSEQFDSGRRSVKRMRVRLVVIDSDICNSSLIVRKRCPSPRGNQRGRRCFNSSVQLRTTLPLGRPCLMVRPVEEVLGSVRHFAHLTYEAWIAGGDAAHGVHPLDKGHPMENAGSAAEHRSQQ
jgi:hypothetical protein